MKNQYNVLIFFNRYKQLNLAQNTETNEIKIEFKF